MIPPSGKEQGPPAHHVLWLTENYPPQGGGMAVSCDRIVSSLRAPALIVDLAHLTARATDWRREDRAHGREMTCPLNDDPEHALNLLWLMVQGEHARRAYTHVVAFGGLQPLVGGPVMAAWLQIPLIVLLRGNDFDAGIFSAKRGDVLRQAIAAANCVGVVARDKVARIGAMAGGAAVEWTPNGIDLTGWELHPADRAQAAKWRQTEVGEGRRVIGMFGQLKRKKGGTLFLEALRRSGCAGRVHLLLVGEAEAQMLEALERYRGEIRFTRLPFVDRYGLLPHYGACDLIAIPSFYDGMPNVLLEAAALGVPVLAADTGGMHDLLRDGENAVLFSPGDAGGCAHAIQQAVELDATGREKLAARARELVARNFNHQAEARRYREILARSAQPHNLLSP